MQARHLSAEIGTGKPFRRRWAKGLADDVRGLARQVLKHPPLFCVVEVFKARVAAPGGAQDIALQSLQQGALAAVSDLCLKFKLGTFALASAIAVTSRDVHPPQLCQLAVPVFGWDSCFNIWRATDN